MNIPTNPYIGPRTFTASERNLFFGREREAHDLLALVISSRLVLFYAQSGAGKSSLINAMLIPALEDEGYKVLPLVRVSGDAPTDVVNIFVYNLINSLEHGEISPEDLKNLSLDRYLAGVRCDENGLVIIIDQFEELFSTHPEAWEKRGDFFKQLSQGMQENPLISVVLVMREDYIAQLDPYTHLLPGGLRTRYYMKRLEREGARQAVQGPVAGMRPFAEGVAEQLVDELSVIHVIMPDGRLSQSPGQFIEPVQLQVVCYNLWESLPAEGTQITAENMSRVGDVNNSLQAHYARRVADVAAAKHVSERAIRQWFERKLITPGGLRNLVLQGTSGEDGGIGDEVVQALQSDLVRAEKRGGATWYELTHDRLVEPILEDNRRWFEVHSSLLQRQAALWIQQGRPDGMLLRGAELERAEQEAKTKTVSRDELDFLSACLSARDRERRERRRNLWIRVLAVLANIALIFAIGFAMLANAQKSALSQSILRAQEAVATATYALGLAQEVNKIIEKDQGLAEAEALAVQAQIALSQSDTIRLGQLLTIEAYKKNKASGEILPSVHQALVNSVSWGNDLLLGSRPFSSASFSFDGNEKRLLVDDYLWNLKDVLVTKLDPDSSQVAYSSFLTNEQVIIVTQNTAYFSSEEDPYIASIINLSNQEKTQIRLTVPEKAHSLGVSLSDNGRWVALRFDTSEIGGALLWDAQDPRQPPQQLLVHGLNMQDLAISQDGKNVAIINDQMLWNYIKNDISGAYISSAGLILATGTSHGSFSGKSGRGLQFSPDGRWLAVQTEENIRIFDPDSQHVIGETLPSKTQEISGFLFSPDSKYLVYIIKGKQYTSILRWSLEDPNRAPIEIYRSTTADITAMDISASGKLIVGDEAGNVRVWDVNQDSQHPLLVTGVHSGRITSILIGPDDQTIVSASEVDGTRLWNLSESESEAVVEYRIPSTVSSFVRIEDGASLAIGGVNSETGRGVIQIYSNLPSPNSFSLESDLRSSLQALAVSGEWIAAGRTYRPQNKNPSYFLDFWERKPIGEESRVVSFTMSSKVSSLAFYGQQYLVIATDSGELWIDDISDLRQLLGPIPPAPENGSLPTGLAMPHKLRLPNDLTNIQSLMFTKNGRYLIGAGASGVRIWNTSQLGESRVYQLPNAVFPVIISPDQKWLLTAGSDHTVQLHDLENITSSPVIIPIDKSLVTRFAFDGKGDQLAVANKLGEIAIYQLPVTKYPVLPTSTFQGSSEEITWLEFSPAGTGEDWLVASSGSQVHLWNTSRPNDGPVTLESNSKVIYASFTNDGERIITLSTDQILRLLSMDLEILSATACRYAGRNLTWLERNRYFPGRGDLQETCPGYGLEQAQTITGSYLTPTPYATAAYLLPPQPLTPTSTSVVGFDTYTVKDGDTLALIAAKFGIDIDTLIQDNNITDPNILVPGQTLRVRIGNPPGIP